MASTGRIDRGRTAFDLRQWAGAFAQLAAADKQSPLDAADLERLATAAYLAGDDSAATAAWTRLHHVFLNESRADRAARWGFWLSLTSFLSGEPAQGTGWYSRTTRILAGHGVDCVELGYVRILDGLMALFGGDSEGACPAFDEAMSIAGRFEDADLLALALLGKGQAVIALKRQGEGLALLDEAMIGVSLEDVSPILVGIIYCAVILTCHGICDLARAREWTMQMNRWCASQPDLVPFRGQCLVHRSEVLQFKGDWSAAIEEARNACRHLASTSEAATGRAHYQLGELFRLRGDFEQADRMFREACRFGCEPQPGAALLLLATGNGDAAASLLAVLDVATARQEALTGLPRARLLGPMVEILLATGDIDGARATSDELSALARENGAEYPVAAAAQAAGSVDLAEGRYDDALAQLREAWATWQRLQMPYEAARARVRLGQVSHALGDLASAAMHYDAALTVFGRLGAAPDVAEINRLLANLSGGTRGGLTQREHEVLALVARGMSNREIAGRLGISEHTVARHVSNIFDKLGVASRTQAVAFAHASDIL